jgi:RNA polymerase sigma-70 factor (ECF subfamily)
MLSTAARVSTMTSKAGAATDTAAVWRDFAQRLRNFIGSRVANPADADDILQAIYLRIHQRLPSLRSDTRLEAWLYRITRNAITDFYRSRAAAAGTTTPSDDREPATVEEEDSSRRDAIGRSLMPMLDRLSPEDREIILLTDIGGATMSEAARQLELSVPGAKSRAQRARARLRKMFIDCCRVELDAAGRAVDLIPRDNCCGPKGSCK